MRDTKGEGDEVGIRKKKEVQTVKRVC